MKVSVGNGARVAVAVITWVTGLVAVREGSPVCVADVAVGDKVIPGGGVGLAVQVAVAEPEVGEPVAEGVTVVV